MRLERLPRVRDAERHSGHEGLDKTDEESGTAPASPAGLAGFLFIAIIVIYITRPAAVGPRRRGFSSAGRAPALQAGGQRFESVILHWR